MDEDSRPEAAGDSAGDSVAGTADAVKRHDRLAALHEALAARGSGDVTEHARKAKAHRDEADRLRRTGETGNSRTGETDDSRPSETDNGRPGEPGNSAST